jgi:imidazolonepropionase-like amidohydrolase
MRRCVRMFAKYGVDSLKINLSGEVDHRHAERDEPVHAGRDRDLRRGGEAWGKRVAAHARSTWSIKQCVNLGIEVIYHASFTDSETLDLLEAHKKEHFIAPGLAWLINTCHPREPSGPDARRSPARWATTASSRRRSSR